MPIEVVSDAVQPLGDLDLSKFTWGQDGMKSPQDPLKRILCEESKTMPQTPGYAGQWGGIWAIGTKEREDGQHAVRHSKECEETIGDLPQHVEDREKVYHQADVK